MKASTSRPKLKIKDLTQANTNFTFYNMLRSRSAKVKPDNHFINLYEYQL